MKIVITESLGISEETLRELQRPFTGQGDTFEEYERAQDPAVVAEQVRDADAVILANMPFPAQVIESAEKLRFIDVAFTGVDHVAIDAAKKRGIAVSNASGYSTEAVAELAVGLALGLARKIPEAQENCRAGKNKAGLGFFELKGKTVGIVGLGRIGSRSAELFHAFGCGILACSRTVHAQCPDYIRQVPLDELLGEADIVVLHCPLNESTRGMIGERELGLMKKTALLLNLARGPVVQTQALAEALRKGEIAGAGIDVFDKEPPLDADEPLLSAPNTLVTPHMAFATQESMLLRAQIVFDNLRAFKEGKQINGVI